MEIKNIKVKTALVLVLWLGFAYLSATEREAPFPKIGLALSSGGARGLAHIGVILALEEAGIPIDYIAGSSMGSIVGSLYACGYDGQTLRDIVHKLDWKRIFAEDLWPQSEWISERFGLYDPLLRLRFDFWDFYIPSGLRNGQRISDELFRLTVAANYAAQSNFDSLRIPYRALAVDAANGDILALQEGSLAQAIRASMAIPLVFQPAYINERPLIDGGVLNILPTDVVRDMGAEIVIASSAEGLFPLGKEPRNILDVANHTIDLMVIELNKDKRVQADVVIRPDLKNHTSSNYNHIDWLIESGYLAAKEKIDEIKTLLPELPSAGEYKTLDTTAIWHTAVSKISITGLKKVKKSLVLAEFSLKAGDPFNPHLALKGIRNIYGTQLFDYVWIDLLPQPDNQVAVEIHVREKYPYTIGFGLNYREDENVSGFIQIVNFNLFGWGERFMPFVRVGEFLQRVGIEIVNDRFFATWITLNNSFIYEKEKPLIYDASGKVIGSYAFESMVGKFSAGVQFNRNLLVSAGVLAKRIWQDTRLVGNGGKNRSDYWSLLGKFIYDTRDNFHLPHEGLFISMEGETTLKNRLNSRPFTKMMMNFEWYYSPGSKNTLALFSQSGLSKNNLPLFEKFRSGGPDQLAGYHRQELWGNQTLLIGIKYRLNVYKALYMISGMDFGNNFQSHKQIKINKMETGLNLGLLTDTPLGPLSVQYGWNQKGREMIYLSAGFGF